MAVKDYQTTPEGIEVQFGTNHLGHFLLTNLLMLQIIAAGAGARILNISSNGYTLGGIRFDDYNFSDGVNYNPWLAYAQSKTANLLFTFSLAEKLKDKNIISFAVTPGLILESNLQADVSQQMFAQGVETYKTVYAGREMPPMEKPKPLAASASTTLVAALDPTIEEKSGGFWNNCQLLDVEPHAKGKENADRLWELSESLVAQKFGY
jgi:NAD(P)-dependent dehydrogenase (short-subunit alcohol dehydrogenase family)